MQRGNSRGAPIIWHFPLVPYGVVELQCPLAAWSLDNGCLPELRGDTAQAKKPAPASWNALLLPTHASRMAIVPPTFFSRGGLTGATVAERTALRTIARCFAQANSQTPPCTVIPLASLLIRLGFFFGRFGAAKRNSDFTHYSRGHATVKL